MNKFLLSAVLLLSIKICTAQTVSYRVSFPNYLHHEAEVSMTVDQLPAGTTRMRMSRSSPGRYATHEFGKNIYNVKAKGADGKSLIINQVEGDVYEIPAHGKSLTVSYTLFGNWVDGTYASIDASHAHLNMPAAFIWVYGFEKRPVKIAFDVPEKLGWTVATQLKKESGNTFSAPNLQYFMDSPVEISTVKTVSWEVANHDGRKQTIHYTTHAPDAQPVVDNYAQMLQKLVLEQQAVFGELPKYDYGEYRFLQDVFPANAGDGMEHRNSTSIVDRNPKIEGQETDMLGTFSHEYFHSWNVERIRPKSLEPFNFSHANMSSELWFAEGFTQYYGPLLLVRSGYYTLERYERELSTLLNQALNTPGAAKFSPAQMSRYAVFADAGVAVDQTNQANIFTSYYTYGAATALALDLRLREDFGLTLDELMREMWRTHGKP
ncbi:MAG: M61 family metallopeptidase [Mucilaginibacter polytrichastri]|nr:M61 family metallopeptidase [Mucilaginibacter polytrichastri]